MTMSEPLLDDCNKSSIDDVEYRTDDVISPSTEYSMIQADNTVNDNTNGRSININGSIEHDTKDLNLSINESVDSPSTHMSAHTNTNGTHVDIQPINRSHNNSPSIESNKQSSNQPEPKPTPLPRLQLSLLAACLYGVLFSQNCLFPFLPFMIQGFYPHLSKGELGYRAGWIGSAFPAGTAISSYVWGRLADRKGRKVILMFGLMTTAVTIGAFGMSPTFEAAVILRFMSGALNGNNGVVKAMVAEVCDKSNMAQGMGIIGLLGGLARLTAPALGGFLADPASQYDMFADWQFFIDWPWALPCFVGTAIATISLVLVGFFLKETLKPKIANEPIDEAERASITKSMNMNVMRQIWALIRGPTGVPILLNAILGLLAITQTEIIPLWLVITREEGGFDSSAARIATLLMALGPFQMAQQAFVYPRLVKRFQYKRLLVYALAIMGVCSIILPYTTMLREISDVAAWVGLFVMFIAMVLARVTAFTCVFVVLNNSSTSHTRAQANGLAQSVTSIAQILGPLFGAYLFASTVSINVWPLDFSFVWLVMAFFCLWAAWLTNRLPASIDQARKDNEEAEVELVDQSINHSVNRNGSNNLSTHLLSDTAATSESPKLTTV